MTRKRKRRNRIVEIGNGPSRVLIYTINRKDGYPQFSLSWKEGGRRRTKCLACMDEAKMVAQQISVQLANGMLATNEATKRDIELLRHCEQLAKQYGVSLAAAIEEWASARKVAGEAVLSDAVRFYQANRLDLLPVKSVEEVSVEFIESRRASGVMGSGSTSSPRETER